MNHSDRRINVLARRLGAKSYLEIGVNQGVTFRDVAIERRTGVDVKFLFDTAALANANTDFHTVTSDNYFNTLPMSRTFDIVFIDGLHVFEQVIRDFSNTVCHSHRRSVIILDDTLPSDVYSSLRDDRQAHHFRHLSGDNSNAWHGDVYKAVAYIHDFWPGINYRTIVGAGNPQTLCWFSRRQQRMPRFDSLEAISRLTYFDYVYENAVIKPAAEEEAIGLCIEELLSDKEYLQ